MRISRYKPKKAQFDISYRVNQQITSPEVQVISDEEGNLGKMTREAALAAAHERGLDLVEVSPKANPPVAKLINYGKFKYEKEKELKRQKAHQKKVEIKGIRLSLRIGQHDFDIRKNQAVKFLNDGDKVQVEMILRGRERRNFELAKEVFNKFLEMVKAEVTVSIEQDLTKKQAGHLTMIFTKA